MSGDADGASAGDYALRLIHLKAYDDGAARAVGRTVLDLGCNDGYGTVLLARGARAASGVDVSSRAIDSARRRPEAAGIDFRVVDGGPLPFPDDSFDVVTAFQVIEHVADLPPFLAEITRVTAPGGTISFTTPNAAIRLDPGMAPWNPFHVREYTATELRLVLAASFASVLVRGLFAPPPIADLEIARATASRDRARHPRPALVRMAVELLPDRARAALRRLVQRGGPGDSAAIRSYTVDDLWYAERDLDAALDLQAICVTDSD